MTWSFLFLVPIVVGYFTVRPHPSPSWIYRIFAPWVPIIVISVMSLVIGWEGSICIIMGLPILLVGASIGGLLGGSKQLRRPVVSGVAAILPLLFTPIEARLPAADDRHSVSTVIVIEASAERVWQEIASVREITQEELRPALFTSLGFPRPLSATLNAPGVGGVRRARFAGGVLFIETITQWQPPRTLQFTIDAQTDSILPTTLDRHVIVGGPYFDVLLGQYDIEPQRPGRVALHLKSELKVSTGLNAYSAIWADAIMRSIQRSILDVIKNRAETPEPI